MKKLRFILENNLPIVIADKLLVIDNACLVIKSVDLLKADVKQSLLVVIYFKFKLYYHPPGIENCQFI